ncbi:MAG: hypothetical protein AAGA75_14390 [Cyanobacteria bacterium P01_E01_bin.6]
MAIAITILNAAVIEYVVIDLRISLSDEAIEVSNATLQFAAMGNAIAIATIKFTDLTNAITLVVNGCEDLGKVIVFCSEAG